MEKNKIVFIHSAGSQGPNEGSNNLVNYIQQSLGEEYVVIHPIMPEPENPSYEKWKFQVAKELEVISGEVILIGHSLGGSVLLKFLSEENFKTPIAGLFLIATPYWGKKDWKVEEYILHDDFALRLPAILNIFLYHSLDDEWVPFEHLRYYQQKLSQATIRALEGRGHSFDKNNFPELIHDIKSAARARLKT